VSGPSVPAVLSTGSPSVICSCGTLARPFRSSTRSLRSLPILFIMLFLLLAMLYAFFVVVFKFHSFFPIISVILRLVSRCCYGNLTCRCAFLLLVKVLISVVSLLYSVNLILFWFFLFSLISLYYMLRCTTCYFASCFFSWWRIPVLCRVVPVRSYVFLVLSSVV